MHVLASFLLAAAPVVAAPAAAPAPAPFAQLIAAAPSGAGGDTQETTVRLAISYFENTSNAPEMEPLKKGFAEMLATDLATAPGVAVLERSRLEALLKELDLGKTAFMDKATVRKLGKGLGATHLVVGSYLLQGGTLRVDARLVDAATGAVAASSTEQGDREQVFEIEARLVKALVAAFDGVVRPEPRKGTFAAFTSYARAVDALDKGEVDAAKALLKDAAGRGLNLAGARLASLNETGRREAEKAKAVLATDLANVLALARRAQQGDLSVCGTLPMEAATAVVGPVVCAEEQLIECNKRRTWDVAAFGRVVIDMPAWSPPCPPVSGFGTTRGGYSPDGLLGIVLYRLPMPPEPPFTTGDLKAFEDSWRTGAPGQAPKQLLHLQVVILERLLKSTALSARERVTHGQRLEYATGALAEFDKMESAPHATAKASRELLGYLSKTEWVYLSLNEIIDALPPCLVAKGPSERCYGSSLILNDGAFNHHVFTSSSSPVDASGVVKDLSISVDGGAKWLPWPRWKDASIQKREDSGDPDGGWREASLWCMDVDVLTTERDESGLSAFELARSLKKQADRLAEAPIVAPRDARFAVRIETVDGASLTCELSVGKEKDRSSLKCGAPVFR